MKIDLEFVVYEAPENNFNIEWSLFSNLGLDHDPLKPSGDSFRVSLDTKEETVSLSKEMIQVEPHEMKDHHLVLNMDPFQIVFLRKDVDFGAYRLYNIGNISLFIPIEVNIQTVL